jgi:ABC-type transporter Mla MlaB component
LARTVLYRRVERKVMLKITAIDRGDQRMLVLEGKLVDPWLTELEKSWDEVQRVSKPQKVQIDLKDVTMISQDGENLLFQMMREGATFNCCRGVLTKHVVQQLERRREEQSGKDRSQP